MSETLQPYLDFLTETITLAGRRALGFYQANVGVEWKPDHSPVTEADRLAETIIRERIASRFPAHAIVGEEFGSQGEAGASHRWIIDPIDGTKSFIRGVPLWAVLIGLEIEGRVRAGAVYLPALDELVAAADGLGCWWNGRRARVSEVADLARAVISTTSPGIFPRVGKRAAWERLQAAAYFTTGWGDAYGYILVATGRVEVMVDPLMAPWDAAPLLPILQEAGGYFGDWQGTPTIYGGQGLATNAALREIVVGLLGQDGEAGGMF